MQYFNVDFTCQFSMARYPFDIQKCNGTIEPTVKSGFFVELVGQEFIYSGPPELMEYIITNYSLIEGENIHFQLVFGRQILSETLTSILPTILIVLVKQSAFNKIFNNTSSITKRSASVPITMGRNTLRPMSLST